MAGLFFFLGQGAPDDNPALGYWGPVRSDGLDATAVATRGLDAVWTFTIRAVDPDVVTLAFAGTEALSGRVWAGEDGPPLADLTLAWVDAAAGLASATLPAAESDLPPGTYNLLLTLEAGGQTFDLHSGLLRVLPAPGSDSPSFGPAYCTAEDMRRRAHRLEDGREPEFDRAAWDRAIDDASRWADETARTRARAAVCAPRYATSATGFPFDWWYAGATPDGFLADLDAALADGRLDSSDRRLREAVARYALSEALSDAAVADRERTKATLLMLGATLRVDVDDDGVFEVVLAP